MRAFLVLAGLLMIAAGVIACWSGLMVNGWWVIAAVGVGLLVLDLCIEHREYERSRT